MHAGSPVIELVGVQAGYDGYAVLEDVNLRINEGDFVGIVGPNGGGKTTLLRIILGLHKPVTGTVRVFGVRPAQSRQRLGYVPQRMQFDRDFPIRALDVVLMGRLGFAATVGPFRAGDRKAAEEALREVGLYELRYKRFGELSGGQQQRVLIARALACGPEILLLDEPVANIDKPAESDFYRLLNELYNEKTIVLVSHDISFVTSKVNRVVCVNRRLVVHPTSEITDDILLGVYGNQMRIVRHDQTCAQDHDNE